MRLPKDLMDDLEVGGKDRVEEHLSRREPQPQMFDTSIARMFQQAQQLANVQPNQFFSSFGIGSSLGQQLGTLQGTLSGGLVNQGNTVTWNSMDNQRQGLQ